MSERRRIELGRRPDVTSLLDDCFRLYFSRFGTFVAIAAVVVFPIQLVVEGIALGQLSAPYSDRSFEPQTLATVAGLSGVIANALITPGCVHQTIAASEGRMAGARESIRAALDAFAPVLAVSILFAVGVFLGLLLLVIPGVFLAVRWYFLVQAVVVDGRRAIGALERSSSLVRGSWWRVLGIAVLTLVTASGAGALIQLPFESIARAGDSAAVSLVGGSVAQTLTAPPVALVTTLLYFDLRARRESTP